ncbi:hypothetical protein QJQ45_019511 [Haematococcus lacustris]|nr:hypothetical protein QJQ45_019511 [Haematococcus lacustris]
MKIGCVSMCVHYTRPLLNPSSGFRGVEQGIMPAGSRQAGPVERSTERWLALIQFHIQNLAAASSAGTSHEANQQHNTTILAEWDAVWEVYLDPKWEVYLDPKLRLHKAQDRVLEQFFKKCLVPPKASNDKIVEMAGPLVDVRCGSALCVPALSDAPPLPPLPTRAPAQPAPAQPASMECDNDSDSESDCDSEPEPQSDSESESEPEPVTQPPQRRCSARLAARAPAAPTGPPLPLDCEDPLMLRQLKDFCMFFANPNFKTCYNQLQRRLVRNRHPMLMPAFEDPSNQALLAKLQELGSIKLTAFHNTIDAHSMQLARIVKLYAKAARAKLGWSGEEAQLFIRMACGYGINAHSSELKAATLDKGHVADLIEEANKHRRLLGMKKEGSLQDTLPLPCRMRHAVHVCRWLERELEPHPPVPGQPKRGKRRPGAQTSGAAGLCWWMSSAVNDQQPYEWQPNKRRATRPAG